MNLTKTLCAIAKIMETKFTLKGRVVTYEEVFSEAGLLPGLTKRADQLASLCFGYGLGATYEELENSLLGSKVNFDQHISEILRLFCLTDVLNEIIRSSPSKDQVSLDELMYD